MHRTLIVERPVASLLTSVALYVAIVFSTGARLAISANYFVLLPILVASLAYGLPGGVISGALGLPMNLLLFQAIGHPEFSPASKAIAEISGLFVGTAFGYLSSYFRKLDAEMKRRQAAVLEKDMLLRELHHRVKNNLNTIKSIVQLQKNRSSDPAFQEAAGLLLTRIYAIALAHDTLFGGEAAGMIASEATIDAESYLKAIAEHYSIAYPGLDIRVEVIVHPVGLRLPGDEMRNFGMIVNELATNAAKHAFKHVEDPLIAISLSVDVERTTLLFTDNGSGSSSPTEKTGLGTSIIEAVAARLGGTVRWSRDAGWRCEISVPRPAE